MDEPIKKMKTGEKRNHSSISTTTTDDNYNLMILLFMSRLINLNTESIILQIENGKTLTKVVQHMELEKSKTNKLINFIYICFVISFLFNLGLFI